MNCDGTSSFGRHHASLSCSLNFIDSHFSFVVESMFICMLAYTGNAVEKD